MTPELLEPLSPALRDAALLNLGWQPDHVVIDASTGPLPADWAEASADWITFFGPFVHLTDLEIFRCLEVAKPALKPDGRLVFTFLDYDVPAHWRIFRQAVEGFRAARAEGEPGVAPEAGWGQLAPPASGEPLTSAASRPDPLADQELPVPPAGTEPLAPPAGGEALIPPARQEPLAERAKQEEAAPAGLQNPSAPPHFLNRATVEAWALHLGLSLEYHYSGEVNWLQPLQSGAVEAIGLGPSLIVLTRLPEAYND